MLLCAQGLRRTTRKKPWAVPTKVGWGYPVALLPCKPHFNRDYALPDRTALPVFFWFFPKLSC
jgi:hypothetical protein